MQSQLQLMLVTNSTVTGACFLQFAAQGARSDMQAIGDFIQAGQWAFALTDLGTQHPG